MNTIYDYPIIGGIALGIKTIFDSVRYIFKKPILLAFPLISWAMTIIIQIFLVIPLMGLGFLTKLSIDANIMKLPISFDDFVTLLNTNSISSPDTILKFKNFSAPSSWMEFLGYLALGLSLILKILIFTVAIYLFYWMSVAISNYIKENIIQNNQLSYKESISYADTKSRSLIKLAILIFTLLILYEIGYTLSYPTIDTTVLKTSSELFWIAIYILSFFIAPLIAFKSASFSNLLKENFLLLIKNPFAITSIGLIVFGIDHIIMRNFNMSFYILEFRFIITLFILPIAQTILYLRIHKKIDAN